MDKKKENILAIAIIVVIALTIVVIIGWDYAFEILTFVFSIVLFITLTILSIRFFPKVSMFFKTIKTRNDSTDKDANEVEKTDKKFSNNSEQTHEDEKQKSTIDFERKFTAEIDAIASKLELIEKTSSKHIDAINHSLLKMQKEICDLTQSIETIQNELKEEKQTDNKQITSETEKFPITRYAQSIDSQEPFGFIASKLTENIDRNIFEITITDPTNATYSFIPEIISDEASLGELISLFDHIIARSSEFDSLPQSIASITIIDKGTLHKTNNVWQITNKQKIKLG